MILFQNIHTFKLDRNSRDLPGVCGCWDVESLDEFLECLAILKY